MMAAAKRTRCHNAVALPCINAADRERRVVALWHVACNVIDAGSPSAGWQQAVLLIYVHATAAFHDMYKYLVKSGLYVLVAVAL